MLLWGNYVSFSNSRGLASAQPPPQGLSGAPKNRRCLTIQKRSCKAFQQHFSCIVKSFSKRIKWEWSNLVKQQERGKVKSVKVRFLNWGFQANVTSIKSILRYLPKYPYPLFLTKTEEQYCCSETIPSSYCFYLLYRAVHSFGFAIVGFGHPCTNDAFQMPLEHECYILDCSQF